MQRRSVRLSRLAQADLESILIWYAGRGGSELAERFCRAFDLLVEGVASGIIQGRRRDFQIVGLGEIRSAGLPRPFRVYLAFFAEQGAEEILVLRILHGQRNLPELLG